MPIGISVVERFNYTVSNMQMHNHIRGISVDVVEMGFYI